MRSRRLKGRQHILGSRLDIRSDRHGGIAYRLISEQNPKQPKWSGPEKQWPELRQLNTCSFRLCLFSAHPVWYIHVSSFSFSFPHTLLFFVLTFSPSTSSAPKGTPHSIISFHRSPDLAVTRRGDRLVHPRQGNKRKEKGERRHLRHLHSIISNCTASKARVWCAVSLPYQST